MILECFGFLGFYMQCTLPEPPQGTAVICPTVIEWPADLQQRAAADIRKLPPGSAVGALVALAVKQRDVNKSCKASKARRVK